MENDEINEFLSKQNYRHVSNYRQKIKERLVEYKGGKCEICGYNKCITALEFHHLDCTKKDFTISASKVLSFEKCKEEVDKCILVCANCHREIHYKDVLKKREEQKKHEDECLIELFKNKNDYGVKRVNLPLGYLESLGILDDIKNGYSKSSIMSKYGLTTTILNSFLEHNGIGKTKSKVVLNKPNKEELQLLLSKNSKSAIGRMYGVSCVAVIKWCRKYGIQD